MKSISKYCQTKQLRLIDLIIKLCYKRKTYIMLFNKVRSNQGQNWNKIAKENNVEMNCSEIEQVLINNISNKRINF